MVSADNAFTSILDHCLGRVFPVNLGQAELPKMNALSSEWVTYKAAALNVGTYMVMHLKMIF